MTAIWTMLTERARIGPDRQGECGHNPGERWWWPSQGWYLWEWREVDEGENHFNYGE